MSEPTGVNSQYAQKQLQIQADFLARERAANAAAEAKAGAARTARGTNSVLTSNSALENAGLVQYTSSATPRRKAGK